MSANETELSDPSDPSESTVGMVYVLLSLLVPWSIGLAQFGTIGPYYQGQWWIIQMTYSADGVFEYFSFAEVHPLYTGSAAGGYYVWGISTFVLILVAAFVIVRGLRPQYLPGTLLERPLVPAGLLAAGIGYCVASAWVTFLSDYFTLIPFGALFMIAGAIHLHRA